MNLNIFLACAVVILSLDQTIAQNSDTEPSQPIQKSILSLIDGMLAAGKTPVNLSKAVVLGAMRATNAAVETMANAGSELLDGSTQAIKHGVDSASDLIKIVQLPGLHAVVNTGNKAINLAEDLKNLAGQALLKGTDSLVKMATSSISTVALAGASLVEDGMDMAANLAKKKVNKGVELVEGAAGTLQTVADELGQMSTLVKFITGHLNQPR